jgi:hypothetical protein
MSPIERGELENSVNAQIVGIVVLSRLLKWIKSSLNPIAYGSWFFLPGPLPEPAAYK